MLIGYARVSTEQQHLESQIEALKEKGAEKIFSDKISGVKKYRNGLNELCKILRKDDTIVVTSLDRLGRSLHELVEIFTKFKNENVHICSLRENIDTSTATGRLIFHIFCSLAEFELSLIQERTQSGLKSARARGRKGGGVYLLDSKDADLLKDMYESKKYSIREICKRFKISRPTVYRYLNLKKE